MILRSMQWNTDNLMPLLVTYILHLKYNMWGIKFQGYAQVVLKINTNYTKQTYWWNNSSMPKGWYRLLCKVNNVVTAEKGSEFICSNLTELKGAASCSSLCRWKYRMTFFKQMQQHGKLIVNKKHYVPWGLIGIQLGHWQNNKTDSRWRFSLGSFLFWVPPSINCYPVTYCNMKTSFSSSYLWVIIGDFCLTLKVNN